MQSFAVYRMELQPHAGQSPHETVDEVCTHVSTFVVKFYRALDKEVFPLHYDGRTDELYGGRLRANRQVAGQHVLSTLDWQIPLPGDPCHLWRIACVCAADGRRVEWQYRAEVGLRWSALPPTKLEMKQHRDLIMPFELLHSILARWTATVDNWPIPVAVELLRREDIDSFVERILVNPRRALPLILLGADGRFRATPARMQDIQRELLGAAHVAALTSREATQRLEELVGSERACSKGLLRIYYPTFTRQSPSQHHPLFPGEAFQKQILSAALHKEAMRMLAQRVPGGPVIDASISAVAAEWAKRIDPLPELLNRVSVAEEKLKVAESQRSHVIAERDEARQMLRSTENLLSDQLRSRTEELNALRTTLSACEAELSNLRAEGITTREKLHNCEGRLSDAERDLAILRAALDKETPDSASGAGELECEIDRAWSENDCNLIELEAARREIVSLQTELATGRKNLELLASMAKRPTQEEPSAPSPPTKSPLPASTFDALRCASDRHGEILDIWDNAWNSAKESNFAGPCRVLEALQAIADVGRRYFAALQEGQSLGPLEQLFRDRIPFKYASVESEMTMAMYGQERVFQCRGRKREIQRHLTLGGGRNCIQIYFDFDVTSRKVIIAYCGRHLPHYRQST